MFTSPKSKSGKTRFVVTALMFVFALFVFVSCETGATIEEESIVIATFPLESGGVIYGGWTPIKIRFGTPMAEADAAYLANAVTVRDHDYIVIAGTVTWEDNAVYFSPAEKWKTGEKYTCFINGSFSALDGRVTVIKTELVFYAASDKDAEAEPPPETEEPDNPPSETGEPDGPTTPETEGSGNPPSPETEEPTTSPPTPETEEPGNPLPSETEGSDGPPPTPEIEEVVFLRKTGDTDYEEFPYDADEYESNALDGDGGLKIRFDEDMDFSYLSESLRMEPSRHYDVTVIDNRTLAVYFEAEPNPVKKITFTVLANTRSLLGEELKRDYQFTFTEWKADLQLSRMEIVESAEYQGQSSGIPLDQLKEKRFQVGAELHKNRLIIKVIYRFSVSLDLTAAMNSLSKIRLIPDDERITKTPFWMETDPQHLDRNQIWGDMEFNELKDPYRYLLVIPGGIDGISDGHGHYLKEDITIMLDVVDWNLIDPYYNKNK